MNARGYSSACSTSSRMITWVEAPPRPERGRRHLVTLTADGKRALRRLRRSLGEWETTSWHPSRTKSGARCIRFLLTLAGKHEPRCAKIDATTLSERT